MAPGSELGTIFIKSANPVTDLHPERRCIWNGDYFSEGVLLSVSDSSVTSSEGVSSTITVFLFADF